MGCPDGFAVGRDLLGLTCTTYLEFWNLIWRRLADGVDQTASTKCCRHRGLIALYVVIEMALLEHGITGGFGHGILAHRWTVYSTVCYLQRNLNLFGTQ